MTDEPGGLVGTDSNDMLVAVASREDVLELALRRIMGTRCESSTAGLGSCWANGRSPLARYTADRCCDSCIAWAALDATMVDLS